MRKLIWQNSLGDEINLTKEPFGIINWEGFSNAPLNIQSQQVPMQDGSVFLDALIENRDLSVTLSIQDGNDLEKRYELERQLIHVLNPKLGEGYLIYTNDFISKRIKCIPQIPLFPNKNSNDPGTQKGELSWTACEPYWEDTEEKDILITGGKRFHITNEGDVSVGVKMTLAISDVTNPLISNITENKKINLNGRFYNNIQINTQTGQKNISNQNFIFDTIINNNKEIFSVTYSEKLGLFVAVGESGISLSSPDGETWNYKQLSTPNNNTLRGVTYSEKLGLFVAVGQYCVGRSVDGINWTFAAQDRLRGVIYSEELELFIAVGESGVIVTSIDGVTWTLQTSGVSNNLMDVCYSEDKNLLVAVGNNVVLTSSDGLTWTNQSANVSYLMSVTYSEAKGLFVAVGSNNYIFTSSDGETWIRRTSIANINLYSVTYSEEYNLFVAVGDNGTIRTSTDGINWVNQTSGVTDNLLYVTYVKEKRIFVSVGENGIFLKSENGETWTFQTIVYNVTLTSIMYVEEQGKYIVVGFNGLISASYDDGENWYNVTSGVSKNLYSIAYAKNKGFVVGGADGTRLFSVDGVSWTNYPSSYYIYIISGVTYSDDLKLFVAVENNGGIMWSKDGYNWNRSAYNKQNRYNPKFQSVIYVKEKGLFVTTGENSKHQTRIVISADGNNWNELSGVNFVPNSISYSSKLDQFIIVGEDGTIIISSYSDTDNLISNLTSDSNMTLGLDVGDNTFLISESEGVFNCQIKYRQKYIGV